MASIFPANPQLNDVFTSNNTTWQWNGEAWITVSETIATTDSLNEGTTNLYYTNTRSLGTASAALIHSDHTNITASFNSASGRILLESSAGGASVIYSPTQPDTTGLDIGTIWVDSNGSVSNLGADLNNGVLTDITSITYPNYITFDTTPSYVPTTQSTLSWDSGEGGISTQINDNINLVLGQEIFVKVYNAQDSTITKGQVVYLFGAQGQRPSVKLASNASDATSAKTFGIAAENITAGAEGFIVSQGIVKNIDTNAYNEGDILWLGNTPGSVTTTKPSGPLHGVFIGVVVKKNASSGRIYVKAQNGYELDELHDVRIISAQNDDLIVYNSASSIWINSPKQDIINTASAAAVNYLVDGAPGALDTLNELAAALNDDANALNLYLTRSSASSTYLTQSSASSTYLTQTSASTTYAPKESPTFTGTAVFDGVNISGQLDVAEIREVVSDVSISSGSVTLDYNSSNIFFISASPSANFTANITNAPTDNGRTITITIIVTQGTTGYIPNVLAIGGSIQTIKWAGGITPTPTSTSGKNDIFNFSLIRRSNAWTVFGTSSTNF